MPWLQLGCSLPHKWSCDHGLSSAKRLPMPLEVHWHVWGTSNGRGGIFCPVPVGDCPEKNSIILGELGMSGFAATLPAVCNSER